METKKLHVVDLSTSKCNQSINTWNSKFKKKIEKRKTIEKKKKKKRTNLKI